ncbi:MAG TPA: hypothetical protein H9894_04820 [Candidatus Desulfovibrio intestinipullorum]|uniref:Thioesterase domain-containing protein n=1 Tax=Candidatus Desulfovibrio intestinipullorum TaxID=2838536 RepID=A0A9D1PXD4_9BACT|nr:hypothetical protein [Candidatus Desulfovibrio intestinipullorum]
MNKDERARWLPNEPKEGTMPLFCLSYAGGGISLFRDWPGHVPPSVQICPVALPGREKRLAEPPLDNLDELVDTLSALIAPHAHGPFALYGHCFGASLAFRLALSLQGQGLIPRLLAVSGSRAPHCEPPFHIAALPQEDFVAALRRFGLTPKTVLDIPELLALFLPSLRADFTLDEALVCTGERPVLSCPILVVHGSRDAIIPEELARQWDGYSTAGCTFIECEGEHVFFASDPALLLQPIVAALDQGTALAREDPAREDPARQGLA